MFIFETGGVRIAHLGDLGHVLTNDQLAAIGAVDVLLVPVGGKFTIDGLMATRVVEQLRPRIMVIPMHYKTDASTIKELEPLALFLDGKTNVRRETASTIALSPMKPRPAAEIVVLPYRYDSGPHCSTGSGAVLRGSEGGCSVGRSEVGRSDRLRPTLPSFQLLRPKEHAPPPPKSQRSDSPLAGQRVAAHRPLPTAAGT